MSDSMFRGGKLFAKLKDIHGNLNANKSRIKKNKKTQYKIMKSKNICYILIPSAFICCIGT